MIGEGGGCGAKKREPVLILYSVYKLCCNQCVAVGSTVVTVGYEGVTEITGDSVDSFTRGEGNSMTPTVTLPENNVFPSGVLTS